MIAPHTPLYVILSATERSGVQSKFCTLAGKTEGRSPDGILLGFLLSFYYRFFATSNPFVF